MRHLLASVIAISLLTGGLSPAFASDHRGDRGDRQERYHDNRGHDRGRAHDNDRRHDGRADNRRDYRGDNRNWSNRNWDSRQWDRGRNDHRFDGRDHGRYYSDHRHFYPAPRYAYNPPKRFYGGSYYRPYGYRYYSWRRGDYLPGAYYAPRYIIHDYRAYRLYAPPRGYHWVRVDNDVVLAAIASGLVVSVVGNLFY